MPCKEERSLLMRIVISSLNELLIYLRASLIIVIWVKEDDEDDLDDRYPRHFRPGGHGLVKVYKVIGEKFIDTGLVLSPYEEEGYRGAPNIAFGDVDGDGVPELITAPGPDIFAPPQIKVFKIDTSEGMGRWKVASQLADYVVSFDGRQRQKDRDKIEAKGWPGEPEGYGANIAASDLDGDGKAKIIVGPGPYPEQDSQGVILGYQDGLYRVESFIAYEKGRYGVNVSSPDVDGDGKAEILTGPGPDPMLRPIFKIYGIDGRLLGQFRVYPDYMRDGVQVSGGRMGE
jgi:serralysin